MPAPETTSSLTGVAAAVATASATARSASAWHLRRFPSLAILGALGALLLLSSLAYRSSRDTEAAIELTLRNYEIIGALDRLQSALDEAQLNQRGYLLTGHARYRQSWLEAKETVHADLALLAATLPLEAHPWLEKLKANIAARIVWSTDTIRTYDVERPGASSALIASGRGQALSGEIRAAVTLRR